MKETLYIFKVDSQYRVLLPIMSREIYSFEEKVYLKLQVINSQKYLQISGREINFFQGLCKLDGKGRFIIPKEVREKFEIKSGDYFDAFEEEIDSKNRTLLLRKTKKR